MTFKLYNHQYNLYELLRRAGYKPLELTEKGEVNAVKPLLGQNYPRFHLYVKEDPEIITFNLHLDQKKPSYEGSSAHSGDYESEVVKAEAQRIQDTILG